MPKMLEGFIIKAVMEIGLQGKYMCNFRFEWSDLLVRCQKLFRYGVRNKGTFNYWGSHSWFKNQVQEDFEKHGPAIIDQLKQM